MSGCFDVVVVEVAVVAAVVVAVVVVVVVVVVIGSFSFSIEEPLFPDQAVTLY